MRGFRQFLELNDKTADHLHKWYKDVSQLSFSNIFGNKVRLVIPYNPNPWQKLKMKIESLVNKKTGQPQGYHVDLAKGIVTQTGTTLQGKPFTRQIKLGKVIEQELDRDDKEYYNRVGNPKPESLKQARFSIVISRHPIDIVRMSDHSGLSSCHSEKGEYFGCAMSEAKGHGPVAYLVKTDDLETVPDLQADEIFEDYDRGIDGIEPIARIRLRKFNSAKQNKRLTINQAAAIKQNPSLRKDDYDLAIPEKRIYGQYKDGDIADSFRNSLLDWARTAQQEIVDARPEMKDFVRMGGSYADNAASTLFNNFFKDERDSGDTDYEGEDDFGDMAEQWEEEIKEIEKKYKFENRVYGSAEVNQDDNRPSVYVNGDVEFILNTRDFINLNFMDREKFSWQQTRDLKIAIEEGLSDLHLSKIEDIDFDFSGSFQNGEYKTKENQIIIRLRLSTDRLEQGPDGFKEMMEGLKEWDKKYREAGSLLRLTLAHAKIMKPSPLDKATDVWDDKLQNFEWDTNSGFAHGIVDVISRPIALASFNQFHQYNQIIRPNDPVNKWDKLKEAIKNSNDNVGGWIGGTNAPLVTKFKQAIEMNIVNRLKRLRTDDRKQLFLPGIARSSTTPNPRWALGAMEINLRVKGSNIELRLAFEIDHNQAKLNNTIEYVHYLDKEFPSIAAETPHLFQQMVIDKLDSTNGH